jgi:hypothetical protein
MTLLFLVRIYFVSSVSTIVIGGFSIIYSTVTDFARFLGLSTSHPLATAT